MLQWKYITFKIKFNQNTCFNQIPEILFYDVMYRKIKKLFCIGKENCFSCEGQNFCHFFNLSGDNFSKGYKVPVILDLPLFPKYNFFGNDVFNFKIKLFSEAIDLTEIFIFILNDMGAYGITKEKIKFTIEDIKIEKWIDKTDVRKMIKGLRILTPCKKTDLFSEIQKIQRIKADFSCLELPKFYMGIKEFSYNKNINFFNKKIKLKGQVGTIFFEKDLSNPLFFMLLEHLGLGQYNYLGLGKVKLIY